MKTTSRSWLWLCWVVAWVVVPGCSWFAPKATPPHVLFISVDTLRADRLGYQGHEAADTPHIDALASRGVAFTNAYAPMGRTTPGAASFFTGREPHHHGAREVRESILPGVTMLAEVLQQAGFRTVGITANPAAGPATGFDRGFDTLLVRERGPERPADALTDVLLDAVGGIGSDERVFVWAHYIDPHFPYTPPGVNDREGRACDRLSRLRPAGLIASNGTGQSKRARSACSHRYDQEIAYTDAAIGKLIARLGAAGGPRPWLIVFTSDHAEHMGEDSLWYQHGPSVHDAGLHVPLVFAGPGVESGAVDPRDARLIDVAPTVLDLLGLPTEALGETLDGVSLAPRLRSGSRAGAQVPPVFAEEAGALWVDYPHQLLSGRGDGEHCLNHRGWAYCWKGDDPARLYRLKNDPLRKNDVSAEHPDRVARFAKQRPVLTPAFTRAVSVRKGPWKLIDKPTFGGERVRRLVHTEQDPAETKDRAKDAGAPTSELAALLDAWMQTLPPYTPGAMEADDRHMLEELGYIE